MKNQNRNLERRTFLKLGAAGLAGISTGPALLNARKKGMPVRTKGDRKMIYRTLGKTGYKLPVVNMGVMNADNPDLVAGALDAGITLLDTAWSYQRGRNEEMIGKVIAGRPRDSFIVATKVPGMPRDRKTGLLSAETDPKLFHESFDVSLQRLGLKDVNILYLHNIKRGEDAKFEPLLDALKKEKQRGRARFIGITTHQNEPEVIRAAVETGVYDVILTGYNFRKDYLDDLNAAVAQAAAAGIGIVAMKTQAGVFWDKEKTDPINMTAALKFALNNPNIHTAIPGFTTFEQLELDLSVMEDLTMTESEILDLRLDNTKGGLYCQQCGRCLPQCPQGLPIPDMMRSYMYAYGYRNLDAAHDLISSLDIPENLCSSCSSCSVRCAKGFDVRSRAVDIARLRNLPGDFFV